MLLYDLTSTYFESDVERSAHDKRQYGYSRDKRGDCRQVVIALIVTPEGFPLSYEVLSGNTADSTTLGDFLDRIEQRYGRANRIWVMDRGVPTEDSLAQDARMGASYLVGTPKGRLTKLEQGFLASPGSACAKGSMSSAWPLTKTPTCSRKVRRASTRSVRCGNAACAATCSACRPCRARRSRAINCS